MKNEKTNTGANRVGMPFILIQDGDFAGMVLVLDSNAYSNYLSLDIYKQLKDLLEPIDVSCDVEGVNEIKLVNGSVAIRGNHINMLFLVDKATDYYKYLSEILGVPVCGIIGTQFMSDHNWKIDHERRLIIIPDYDSDYLAIN